MHVRSVCGQAVSSGRCNACCVAAEFILGVLRHLMMKLTLYYVVFVFKPLTKVVRLFVFTMC